MKKKIVAIIAVMLVSLMIFSLGARIAKAEDDAAAPELKINAKAYILADFDGKTEISSKNKSERLPIASMVKIMTLDLVFENLESGQISLDDDV